MKVAWSRAPRVCGRWKGTRRSHRLDRRPLHPARNESRGTFTTGCYDPTVVPALRFVVIAIVFTVITIVSWQKWPNLILDSGREMNLPLRLLSGEMLYADAYYLYGPVAPYLNALLYKGFGVHLNTLYLAGMMAALLVLFLVFRLGQRLMKTRNGVTLALVAVLALCIFKQGGSYFFPYTFSALYGTLLGLIALTAQVRCTEVRRSANLEVSGILTGLTLLCKLEFGFAALASQVALVFSARSGDRAAIALRSLLPAVALPTLVYIALSAKVPWEMLIQDTYLLPGTVPAELVHFNRLKLGLDDPARTFRELLSSVAILGSTVGLIGLVSVRAPVHSATSEQRLLLGHWTRRLYWLTGLCFCLLLSNVWLLGTRWDVSPLRALPLLCAGGIFLYAAPGRRGRQEGVDRRILLLVGVYSLTVLARVLTRVPSGGAHGAYLLPAPLLLFTYLATTAFPGCFRAVREAERRARRIVLALLAVGLSLTIGVITYRYQQLGRFPLRTERGTVRVNTLAFAQALDFIAQNTKPGDYLLALPEGSTLNFLASRPVPLRYEILTPGFLDTEAEQRSIEQLREKEVQFVFLLNRPTAEFGATVFGRDYYVKLMRWIDVNYDIVALFGEGATPASTIGDSNFFIRCYRKKKQAISGSPL